MANRGAPRSVSLSRIAYCGSRTGSCKTKLAEGCRVVGSSFRSLTNCSAALLSSLSLGAYLRSQTERR